jgi:electron transfer flavoprotein alpha subunit
VSEGPRLGRYETPVYAEVLSGIIQKERPEIVLFGATPIGADLAPRVAQKERTGLVSGCTGLEIDTEQRLLVCTRTFYGGRLAAEMICPERRPQMALLKEGAFPEAYRDPYREGTVEEIPS